MDSPLVFEREVPHPESHPDSLRARPGAVRGGDYDDAAPGRGASHAGDGVHGLAPEGDTEDPGHEPRASGPLWDEAPAETRETPRPESRHENTCEHDGRAT